jgi:dihydroorotase-like cyclic amidohydrolase
MMSTLIRNGTVVNADSIVPADILVEGERIKEIRQNIPVNAADRVIDAIGLMLLPGGIDAHTHLDMPFGGTTSSDDFEPLSSTSPSRRAALACAMPSTPGGRKPRAGPASISGCT